MGRSKKTYRELTHFLSYILGLIAFLSLWNVADSFFAGLLFLLFLLGIYNDLYGNIRIPRIFLNSVALLGTLISLLSVSFDNLVEPVANALLLLLSIKFLEEKKLRDFYQILLLSVLSVALSTLINTGILFLILLILELFVGIFFLFLLLLYKRFEEKTADLRLLRKLFIFSISFGIAVFFISWIFFFSLPRVESPLIDVFQTRDRGLISGISDEISLGEVGEIQLDRSIILRAFNVEFKESPYWRVQVFDTYKNNRWIKTISIPEEERKGGQPYTIILEPTYDTFLPLLNYPTGILDIQGIKEKPKRFKGGFYELREPVTRPIKIVATYTHEPPRDKPLELYLQVPQDIPNSIKELAGRLSKGAKSNREKIERVKKFFKEEGFEYTLKLEVHDGDPLEDFLFRKKKGNCEYYASATALLLRLMGVPARVVSGFHGAIKNDYGDYYFVVGGMAHVWVEAYAEGAWLTVDTTPPYIPESLRDIDTLTYIYDAILTFWYRNIVNFSHEKQKNLMTKTKELGVYLISFLKEHLAYSVLALVLIVLVGLTLYLYLYKLRKTPDNLLKKLKKRLKHYGIEAELPEEILKKTAHHPKRRYIEFVVRTYQRWKYSPIKDKEELKEAYKVLKKI
ncbi:transglutaminase family protein [Aquifex sp.]